MWLWKWQFSCFSAVFWKPDRWTNLTVLVSQDVAHPCQQSLTWLFCICLERLWIVSAWLWCLQLYFDITCAPFSAVLLAGSVICGKKSCELNMLGGAAGWGTEIESRIRGWNRTNSRQEPCSVFLRLEIILLPPTLAAPSSRMQALHSAWFIQLKCSTHRWLNINLWLLICSNTAPFSFV